jgi:hypothetical protein
MVMLLLRMMMIVISSRRDWVATTTDGAKGMMRMRWNDLLSVLQQDGCSDDGSDSIVRDVVDIVLVTTATIRMYHHRPDDMYYYGS